MKRTLLISALCIPFLAACSRPEKVSVVKDITGSKLTVDGRDFFVKGMNWDYFPIGKNYEYELWKQPEGFIKEALDQEMPYLAKIGVNAIRVYTGIQPKWIEYIYRKYGIYTMINHSFGRYGLKIDSAYVPNTDYTDTRVRAILLQYAKEMAEEYRNTPGLLIYLLGNENNFGLFWGGAETEDIPVEQKHSVIQARALYRIFDEAALTIKAADSNCPVAVCNGDLLFVEIFAAECKNVDILGSNMYRGVSFTDAFRRVKANTDVPFLLTEFGADAFNAISNTEDQDAQAYYLVNNWKEICENATGLGQSGNCIGGFTFQFSDGWWKSEQVRNLDIHDTAGSWNNGGYLRDYQPGVKNMNEEWFGICAKGPVDAKGHFPLYPRKAWNDLQKVHKLDPYAQGMTLDSVENYFSNISR